MANLLEIVLENISRSQVCQLMILILGHADQIIEIQCSEELNFSSGSKISEDELQTFMNLSNDSVLTIKLNKLNIAGCNIPSVLLRLVKYENRYDIDFNFSESDLIDIDTTVLMKKLHDYVSEISKKFHIVSWYGGIEPASDVNTRYFTDYLIGPLS